ncbi:DUF1659 domain-containing protein [Bacillus sp. ISL-18]|uniref:DUF1659 domain-containing protein n=1 Tax=Bacillaceae TaxID=186817 RepID=UPI001BE5C3FC|nr:MULTISPECIES: DUF1659 domain-containing protein [Bacillaceae]MBT2658812.1 DUF1659 domain-containing protein [Bacillus sp. ISL-18]ULT56535.1 DUF1659 domain-containing protein [Neobacillus drentensis]
MAEALLEGTKLRLVFDGGIDNEGNPILKSRTFSNVKKESTVDQLHQAAQAISALCNDSLNSVERTDTFEILG